MRLNHRKICDTIAKEFNLDYYKKGKFFYFHKTEKDFRNEIWFIEQIPAGKYLKTIYTQFFDMWWVEKIERNNNVEERIWELYKQQRKWQPVEWCFSCSKFNEVF